MKNSRLLPFLGPAAFLYLLAEVASATSTVDRAGWLVASIALGLAFLPVVFRTPSSDRGHARVVTLGVSGGISLLALVAPHARSVGVDTAHALAIPLFFGVIFDLAWDVPDAWDSLGARLGRTFGIVATSVLMLAGLLIVGPPVHFGDATLLVPDRLMPIMWTGSLVLFAAAMILRLVRRRLGSGPEALAANAWGILGLVAATLTALVAATLDKLDAEPIARVLFAISLSLAVFGHVWLLDIRRRWTADRSLRDGVTVAVTLVAVAALSAVFQGAIPHSPIAMGIAAAATVGLGWTVQSIVAPIVRKLLAPSRGMLLDAIEAGRAEIDRANTLDDIARALLGQLRSASGDMEAAPLLFAFMPERCVHIDAAGEPHASDRSLSQAILERIQHAPGEVLAYAPLAARVVRHPEERPLAQALATLDAFAIVPLPYESELEGALVIPRGKRAAKLTLEELLALSSLGNLLAGRMALIAAKARADERAATAQRAVEELTDRVDELQANLMRARSEIVALERGRVAASQSPPVIAYSTAMKTCLARVDNVAALDVPITLIAQSRSQAELLARRVHAASGRGDEPFIVTDLANENPDVIARLLFGEAREDGTTSPGWLRLAGRGTIFLADLPALPQALHHDLAEAIATRQFTARNGATAESLDARIIATSRVPVADLVDGKRLDTDLAERLKAVVVDVPRLRDREEDFASLVLLILDRVARTLGKSVLGIEPEAQEHLARYDWPGDVEELESVLLVAAERAPSKRITIAHLPILKAYFEK